MPVTDLASYLPTMDEFIVHWSGLNASMEARGQRAVVLRDGRTLEEFVRTRSRLEAVLRAHQEGAIRRHQLQRERNELQADLRARLVQLRDAALPQLPGCHGTRWKHALSSLDGPDTRYLGQLVS